MGIIIIIYNDMYYISPKVNLVFISKFFYENVNENKCVFKLAIKMF